MDKSTPIGVWRAAWLLLRLQQTRFTRQITGSFRYFQKKDEATKRTATASKSKRSWLIAAFVALSLVLTFTNLAFQAIRNFKATIGSVPVAAKAKPAPAPKQASASQQQAPGAREPLPPVGAKSTSAPKEPPASQQQTPGVRESQPPASTKSNPAAKQAPANRQQTANLRAPLPPAPGFAFSSTVLNAIAMQALLFLVAVTLLSIGNGELLQQDWDLEWLVTLPVRISTLLCSRILVRAFVNPMGLYAFVPLLLAVAIESGYEAKALLVTCAVAIPLLVIAATVQTIVDTGFRLRLGPSQLRNLQAFISVAASLTLLLAMSPGLPAKITTVADLGSAMPSWTFWLPPGLAIQAIASSTAQGALQSFGLLVAEAAIFLLLGLVLLKQLLRYGIIAAGARESGRAERLRKATSGSRKQSEGRWGLTAIQGREVRLLGRDRNFLVQTLVMPIILVGTQIVFNQGVTAWLASINNHPEYLAIAAFGVAAYLLMFSAFQTLNAEGQALWMLYTFPVPLESILRQKALLWGAASLVYPVAIFGFAVASYGPALSMLQPAFLVLIGVPVFAIIATSLGVFACDPLAQNLQRRVKVSYTYLFLLLASTYLYSLYASSIWQRLSLLILTMLLAFALWQKARDHLPYLLDPAASPPARVSVSDGLIAALLFFVLQGIVLLIRSTDSHKLTGFDVLLAFSVAGATTFGVMRLAFWRLKSQGVPRVFGRGVAPALMLGVVGGAVASAAAILYLKLTLYLSLFETTQGTALLGSDYTALIFILAVVAAPIFEEFIFRGLIFGGLRRSMGVAGAVLASAAIFAIVHPPVSVIPVFGLGIVTALVYERTRLLIGPMAAHAVYNAVVVGFQYLYLTGA